MAVTAGKRPASGLAELGLGRIGAFAGLVLLALVVQSTILVKATLLGVIPQITLVVVVALAFSDGERVGVVTGFASGLLQDLMLPQSIIGLTALVYTLIGFAVGYLRQYVPHESVWAPVGAVALASAAAEVSYALLAILLGQPWVSLGFTARVAGLVVVYNTLFAPLTVPLVRRVADRFRPERIYRW